MGRRAMSPPPLWGRGRGGGGDCRTSKVGIPPTPNPSPQGGGESAHRSPLAPSAELTDEFRFKPGVTGSDPRHATVPRSADGAGGSDPSSTPSHRPLYAGGRFSAKAVRPSVQSSLSKIASV